jgi:peptide/nickel transport system ATP-binding protein
VHTVGDQIVEAIMLHQPVNKREARNIALQMLKDVGIPMPEQRLDAYSWQLSGGLRQRAIIAMALSCNPRLLIADEPTTAVDVTTQAQVLRLLRRLQEERNAAIIFITHDLGVIAQMADYVMVMYLGLVMEQGAVDDIFHAPRHPYTQALLRSIPSLESTPRVELPTISGSIPHPFNKPKGCPFHPRCEKSMAGKCDVRTPALEPVGEKQWVSCFLYHDAPILGAPLLGAEVAA